jgi:hypothetical protein
MKLGSTLHIVPYWYPSQPSTSGDYHSRLPLTVHVLGVKVASLRSDSYHSVS